MTDTGGKVPHDQTTYQELPSTVQDLVEEATGPVHAIEPITAGLNSAVTARLRAGSGDYFVKGLRADHKWAWTQQREANIAPHVAALAPECVAHVITAGWDVLVFTAAKGRHADYGPDSPDLPLVLKLLQDLGSIDCPRIELRLAEDRLANYVDSPEQAKLFSGDALLHTEWNRANVLIGDRAQLVDWGWATRGAPWLDAGYWLIWLIASGHDPASAERWAAKVPAWAFAPAEAVDIFAKANVRLWEEINNGRPKDWSADLVGAAKRWAAYRRESVPAGL